MADILVRINAGCYKWDLRNLDLALQEHRSPHFVYDNTLFSMRIVLKNGFGKEIVIYLDVHDVDDINVQYRIDLESSKKIDNMGWNMGWKTKTFNGKDEYSTFEDETDITFDFLHNYSLRLSFVKDVDTSNRDRKKNQTFYNEPKYADVQLKVGDTVLHVNKMHLALFSEYFHILFYGNFTEQSASEVELKEINEKAVVKIIRKLYGFHIDWDDNELLVLYETAKLFMINSLVKFFERYISSKVITLSTANDIHELTSQNELKVLQNRLFDFIKNSEFESVQPILRSTNVDFLVKYIEYSREH